ncbi:hypothetical protein ACFVFI_35405 [Streptomyces sp. NPDC057705]|uniref:hypothetical protein n=1 Tax=Streptomyces sp. NPDC057705 TaxID=3346222 RepID=UPI003698B24F
MSDEQANPVWGLEQTAPTAIGEPRRCGELCAEGVAHPLRLDPPSGRTGPLAPVAYEAMNSVPEHWIPFIAVHADEGNRSVRLQRAAMPHPVGGRAVQARTELPRPGLDLAPRPGHWPTT